MVPWLKSPFVECICKDALIGIKFVYQCCILVGVSFADGVTQQSLTIVLSVGFRSIKRISPKWHTRRQRGWTIFRKAIFQYFPSNFGHNLVLWTTVLYPGLVSMHTLSVIFSYICDLRMVTSLKFIKVIPYQHQHSLSQWDCALIHCLSHDLRKQQQLTDLFTVSNHLEKFLLRK